MLRASPSSPEGEGVDGTFVCEELRLGAEGVREIMIAVIVLKLHAQHGAVSLGQRTDRLEDADVVRLRRFVIPACKVVRLRSGAARHALVGVVGIDPDQTHTVNLLYGIEAAIAIGAIDRFAHAAARLSPCRELVSSQRAETVAASVIDHIVETKVAARAVFRRGQQLEAVGKHHPCGTCCIQDLVFPHANAKRWLSEWLELCLFAQFDVDCHGIALLVSVNLAMLVVLHDVHLSGIFGRDVLRGKIVATAKHIETADVEVRDVLAHIADGTIVRNADARQVLQSVFERHIAFLEEGCEVVRERVAPLAQRVGLHRHLLQ